MMAAGHGFVQKRRKLCLYGSRFALMSSGHLIVNLGFSSWTVGDKRHIPGAMDNDYK